ncbi:hypothetical protein ACWET9_06455 [Streptomyces sp. NPDC004059]
MATQIVQAPTSAECTTAPLPADAVAAMRRLELALAAPEIVRAVTRYEVATARYDELIAKPASDLKPVEVDAIGDAQQVIAESFGVLAEAGMHHLVLALADQTVAHFDHWGSIWGYSTVEDTEGDIAAARAEGASIDEWETVDRDGRPLRVVRATHRQWGTDIHVFSTWDTRSKAGKR